jgi:hypothetical protein
MTTAYIVGIPIHMDRQGDHTVIRPQMRDRFTPIQSRLVSGWLEHRGNVLVEQQDYITVEGDLKPGSVANAGK